MKVQFHATEDAINCRCWLVKSGELATASLGIESEDMVKQAAAMARFEGTAGQVFETFVASESGIERIALLGIGKGENLVTDFEKAGGALTAKFLTTGVTNIALELGVEADGLSNEVLAHLLFGAVLRAWRIDQYHTKMVETSKPTLELLTVRGAPEGLEAEWQDYVGLVDGISLTRQLVSEPPNVIYPQSFVDACQHLADLGVEISVLDDKEMAKLGMGALLGVAQGSRKPARMLAMRWDGTGGKAEKPVVLVGKGVTFDTGGISIKPAAGMEDMKWDMGGAGAVAGTMKALAARKAKAHVVGICGLVENMPDGDAQRPGDIVTSMSGQTIEIINTDAEGRLVLCDALHWAQEVYEPEIVIDLATLTGAIIISLGNEHAGLFSNDDGLADKLTAAGKASGDPLWRFPLSAAYNKMMDSQIADMKNAGARNAGSITAAQFLQRFIKDGVKWAHLDIAGMVWADKPGPVWDKGATGYGVRLLNKYIADNHES